MEKINDILSLIKVTSLYYAMKEKLVKAGGILWHTKAHLKDMN